MINNINNFFMTVLTSSIAGGILAVVMVLVKKIFKTKINPRIYCVLWLMIFAKLMMTPIAPKCNFSIFNAEKCMETGIIQKNTIHLANSFIDSTAMQSEMHKDSSYKKILQSHYTTDNFANQKSSPKEKTILVNNSNNNSIKFNILSVCSVIWLIGFFAIVFTMLYARAVFKKRVNISKTAVSSEVLNKINDFYYNFKLEKDMWVFVCSCIDVPCVFGVLRPEILIPKKLITDERYQDTAYMLMHEIAHIKRKDNLINVITSVLNSVHWFNPIIWYVHKQLHMDREECCDLYALEQLRKDESVSYGMVLINFSSIKRKNIPMLGVSGYYNKINNLERRIKMIKNFKKGSYKISSAAIAICMTIGILTLTNPAVTNGAADKSGTVNKNDISYSKFNIGSTPDKEFNSLERARRFTALDFKVPDFIPAGYSFSSVHLSEKAISNADEVILQFTTDEIKAQSSGKDMRFFFVAASKGNLLNLMKNQKNMYSTYTVTKKAMKIGDVNGICVNSEWKYTNKAADTSNYDNPIYSTEKDFVWQDNGIWYDIKIYSYSLDKVKNKNIAYVGSDISLNDLKKVVASFISYKEVSSSKYISQSKDSMEIYNQDDLKEAKNLLGFVPRLISSLPNGYLLHSADVTPAIYKTSYDSNSSESANQTTELFAKYCLKNKPLKIENTVYISQRKAFPCDNSLENTKYITEKDYRTNKLIKIPVKYINVNNIKVIAYDDFSNDNKANSNYLWIKDHVYYNVTMTPSIKNRDEIIRTLVTKE